MSEKPNQEGQQPESTEIDLLRQAAAMIESEDLSKWSSSHDRALLQLIKEATRGHGQAMQRRQPETDSTRDEITPTDTKLASMEANDRRYRWLAGRLLAADFDWQGKTVLVFSWPKNVPVGGTCDQNIDAAMSMESSEQMVVEPQPDALPTTENLLAAIYSVARSVGPQCVANMELALYKSMTQTAGGGR